MVACHVFASLIFVFGCDDQMTNPAPDREHNPNAPTGNALVSGHYVAGDPTKTSSIYEMQESSDGTWLARGLDDGIRNLERRSAHGEPLWSNRIQSDRPQAMTTISTSWLQEGVVTAGTVDSDGDGRTNYSIVKAWTGDGRLLDEIALTGSAARTATGIVLSRTAPDRLELLVVGSIRGSSGAFDPWVQRVAFHPDSTLERGEERTYPALRLCQLLAVERDSVDSVFYVGGNVFSNDSTVANAVVLRFSDSLDVEWRTDLVTTPGFMTWFYAGHAIDWTGSSILTAGATQVEKDKAPGGGGYWHAGLIASLSSDGVVQWTRSVVLSAYDEVFHAASVDGAHAYAVGDASSFYYSDSNRAFGYGLVTKLDLATGTVLANYTFGDPSYESGFNTITVHGDQAWCGGFTEEDLNGRFRSWFVEIDSTRPATAIAPVQAATPGVHPTTGGRGEASLEGSRRPDRGVPVP